MEKKEDINFSIIIPVYNAEKYIKDNVMSILNQTYGNFEIILINDGSQDNSKKICMELEKSDKRIKVINKENEGVSKTRNLGMEVAKFKYICFLDADDYVEKDMLETYVRILKNNENVEMINCGFFSEVMDEKNKEKSQIDIVNYIEKFYKTREEIKKDFIEMWDKHLLYNIWNKVYVKQIIEKNNIKFPDYNWGEDIEFNRKYLLNISNMYNTEKSFYHYIRGRNNTITGKYIKNLYDIRLKENIEFKKYFEEFGIALKDYSEFCARRHIERTIGCIENLFSEECDLSYKEKYKEVKRIILDETTRQELKIMKPQSKKIKILLIPYRMKLVIMAMAMGKILSICKRRLPKIFNSLKNKR